MATSLHATGVDQGATLRWSTADTPEAAAYVLYCDDGATSSAKAVAALDLSDECPSRTALVAGQEPSVNVHPCAVAAADSSTMHVTGLYNGQPYAFAVATKTRDGQTGALSALTCAIPSTNGEYELDGTLTGKNTSCAISSVGGGGGEGALLWVSFAVAALVLRRRQPRLATP